MKKEKIAREVNVYSYSTDLNHQGLIKVEKGIPIMVEFKFSTQEYVERVENFEPNFEEAIKKFLNRILDYDFEEFSLLYKELAIRNDSVYFRDAWQLTIAKLEQLKKEEQNLEHLLNS